MQVTVSGASGFIGSHIILLLLEKGYEVVGTLRNLDRSKEVLAGLKEHTQRVENVRFVQANLSSNEGWNEALQGSEYFFHIASPLPKKAPSHEMEIIGPARDGALRALRAAMHVGVKGVIMTSSISAIISGHLRTDKDIFNETHWSDLTKPMGAYEKSKTLAERAAWDCIRSDLNTNSMELTAIAPSLVLGPSLLRSQSASTEIVRKLIQREMPGCPKIFLSLVDVRDVAKAHVQAMLCEESAGKRYIVAGPSIPMRELALFLQSEYRSKGWRIPTRTLPSFLVRFSALFDKSVAMIVHELDKPLHLSSALAKKELHFEPRTMEEMVKASVESLLHHGVV